MSKYTIGEELGRGGMGVMFRARHEELGREVALKMLLPGPEAAQGQEKRFLREVRALMAVQHPHVVRVFDCGELDGRAYYAMELIAGTTLREVLARGGMARARALAIARQVAKALAACHAASIVHRDVKAENVMLGAADHVTLMDFGLVRVEGGTVLTATGQLVGTPSYLAPESLTDHVFEAPVDVYALGILIMRMLAGRTPFTTEQIGPLLVEIARTGPIPLATLCPDTPAPLAELVGRMVQRAPGARPTMADVEARLGELAKDPAVSRAKRPPSRPLATSYPPVAPARSRAPVAALALALVAAGAAAAMWSRNGTRAADPASPAPVATDAPGSASAAAPAPARAPVPLIVTTKELPGERTIGVQVFQLGDATFDVFVERIQDGKRMWTARAGPSRVSHFVAKGLAAGTDYRVRVVSRTSDGIVLTAPRVARTRKAGFLDGMRQRLGSEGLTSLTEMAGVSQNTVDAEPELVPTMLARFEAAEKRGDMRTMVKLAGALGESGDPLAAPALVRQLARGGSPEDRYAVVRAAGRLGHPDVVPGALKMIPTLNGKLASAAGQLLWADRERVLAEFRNVLENPEKYPRWYGGSISFVSLSNPVDELVPSLARHVILGGDAADVSINAISQQKDAVEMRRAFGAILSHYMKTGLDGRPVDHLLRCMARIRPDAATATSVARLALTSCPAAVRVEAARVLAFSEPAIAERPLVTYLTDPDPLVRRVAALSLGRLEARGAVDALLARLAVEREGLGRIPRALGMIGDARAVEPLLALASRPAAPYTTGPRPSAEVDRAEALWALAQLKVARARPVCESALASPVDYVRFRAAEALGWLRAAESLPALERAAARPGELPIVHQAIARARDWIRGSGPPAGACDLIDPAECFVATDRVHPPGAALPGHHAGAWAQGPGMPLVNFCANSGGHSEPRLNVRASIDAIHWGDREAESRALWAGGPLSWEIWGPRPDAIGFVTVWLER